MPKIKNLQIYNFRNLKNQIINFNNNFNVFIASNGKGKTNLIEALYFLGQVDSTHKCTTPN